VSNDGINITFKNEDHLFSVPSKKGPNADYFIKILLLGDTGVGKSSLMVSYAEGEFP
jgi:GTPase SAR1 family protein